MRVHVLAHAMGESEVSYKKSYKHHTPPDSSVSKGETHPHKAYVSCVIVSCMGNNTESLTLTLSERQKRAIRREAAERDVTMAEFVRSAALDSVPGKQFRDQPNTDDNGFTAEELGIRSPLDDFVDSRLSVTDDAPPISKRELFEEYRAFCETNYPTHDVETQHKFSREIGAIDGVETGRRYLQENPTNDSRQTRCFLNLKNIHESPSVDFG